MGDERGEPAFGGVEAMLDDLEELYKEVHSAADSFAIRMFGRGAHGSMPEASIDPVVMAATTVLRLQTIVSREVAATQSAVVSVGVLQAGTKENVIPDEATIKLNVRTFDEGVRGHVLEAIKRIVEAEAAAPGAPRPPEITPLDQYQLVRNDPGTYQQAQAAGRLSELPTNHNPRFAPVLHPTLETGVEALIAAACAWLDAP